MQKIHKMSCQLMINLWNLSEDNKCHKINRSFKRSKGPLRLISNKIRTTQIQILRVLIIFGKSGVVKAWIINLIR